MPAYAVTTTPTAPRPTETYIKASVDYGDRLGSYDYSFKTQAELDAFKASLQKVDGALPQITVLGTYTRTLYTQEELDRMNRVTRPGDPGYTGAIYQPTNVTSEMVDPYTGTKYIAEPTPAPTPTLVNPAVPTSAELRAMIIDSLRLRQADARFSILCANLVGPGSSLFNKYIISVLNILLNRDFL